MNIKHLRSSKVVGLDFGTTYSTVCWVDEKLCKHYVEFDQHGHNNDNSNDNAQYLLRSSVKYIQSDDKVESLYGCSIDADVVHNIKMYISNPNYKHSSMDTKIVDGIPHLYIHNQYKSILDIAADLLKYIRHKTNQHFQEDVRHVVLAMPARFDEIQKQWIIEAAIRAGWHVVRIISEPTAGFLACNHRVDGTILDNAHHTDHINTDTSHNNMQNNAHCDNASNQPSDNSSEDGIYGIYDLGGSTFDFSLVKKQHDIVQVIGTSGDLKIGMEQIYKNIYQKQKQNPDDERSDNDLALSGINESGINDIRNVFTISGVINHQVADIFIDNTIGICQKVIHESGISIDHIHSIILIGGGSKMPNIQSKLNDLGLNVRLVDNPQLMVATGCAIYARNLIDKKSCLLLDVAPLSLGIEIYNGMIETMIHKNSPLPVSKSMNFTNVDSQQTHIVLNVFQGDSSHTVDCQLIASVSVEIEPSPINTQNIQVIFKLDHNNILNIYAINLNNNKKYSVQIDTKAGLTIDMVNRLKNTSLLYKDMALAQYLNDIDSALRTLHPKYAEQFTKDRQNIQNIEDAKHLLHIIQQAKYDIDFNSMIQTAQFLYDSLKK